MGRHDIVDEDLLRHLAGLVGNPMITVTVPTHRWGPHVAQDRVLLLDTVERLADSSEHQHWPEWFVALDRLRGEVSSMDMEQMLDGVVLYASADAAGHVSVAVPVTTRVAVGTRVALTPVAQHVEVRRRAVVVSVADTGARAWWKDHLSLTEVVSSTFPFEAAPDDHRYDRGGFGRQRTALDTKVTEPLVKEVDRRIAELVGVLPVPVFVAATSKLAARFAAATRLGDRLMPLRLGVLNHVSAPELVEVAPRLDEHLAELQRRRRATALAAALDTRRLATDLDEITELVHDGNSAVLMLDDSEATDVDPVHLLRRDHVVATMLARGDDVQFVDASTLGVHGPHVLITRY
jgi:hypothetical protein